jgi:hypothetical protein
VKKRIIFLVGALLALTLVIGCGPQEPAKGQKSPPPATEPGKKESTNNRIYDEAAMPIRTQYPGSMSAAASCSGEGCGFNFKFKDGVMDQAEVHIFLPRGAATAAAQEPFVTGARGLLETNGWKNEGESKETGNFPYGWVRKVIDFSDLRNKDMVGKILLGEADGQAVEVILYYPGERGREFLANAGVILENLHFKSDKLPLGKAH